MRFYPPGLIKRNVKGQSQGSGADAWGSGKFRWCACKTFGIYRGSGKFGTVIKPGEELHLEVIRPNCDSVTRKIFANHHSEWMMDLMAQSEGFGYKGVFMHEPDRLMAPLDVVKEFGLNVPDHFYRKRDRTAASVLKRAERYAALKTKGKSKAVNLADDVARLLGGGL